MLWLLIHTMFTIIIIISNHQQQQITEIAVKIANLCGLMVMFISFARKPSDCEWNSGKIEQQTRVFIVKKNENCEQQIN